MAQFDDLVAKYRNLSYGRLAGTNPSAVNSLLNAQDRGTNSITSPNYFGNIPIEQQQYLDTPSGFIGQNQFRIDPKTGIPVFETPTTEAINQGIEMGGGTVGSGSYDQDVDYGDEGYAGVIPVDPVTGLVGTTTQERERGGGRDGFRFGKPEPEPSYNPNLLGAYIGYNNPKYAASPYGEDANILGDFASGIVDSVTGFFSPDKGPLGGEVTAQDFNVATGGSKRGPLGSYDPTKDTAFGGGNRTVLNNDFTPDPKVTKEVNLSLNKTADPLSLPAGRFKGGGKDKPDRNKPDRDTSGDKKAAETRDSFRGRW